MDFTNIKDGVIVIGLVAGVGGIAYLIWKTKHVIKKKIDNRSHQIDKLLVGSDRRNNKVKKVTGGTLDFQFRSFGKSDTAQAEYDSARKLHEKPLLNVLNHDATKVVAGVLLATPAAPVVLAAGTSAAVVNAVGKKVRKGKDNRIVKKAMKEKNSIRDQKLAEQTEAIIKSRTDGEFDYNPPVIKDPFQKTIDGKYMYLTDHQVTDIEHRSKLDMDHHHKAIPSKYRGNFSKMMKLWHGLKEVQMVGFFLDDDDSRAVNMNANTFIRAYSKIIHPHRVVNTNKKHRQAAEKFINNHGYGYLLNVQ